MAELPLECHVLLTDGIKIILKLIDFFHILILDTEVLELSVNLTNTILHLVLLLDVYNKLIEFLLQGNDLLVYASGDLILLSLIENELFNIVIDLLNAKDDLLSVSLYLSDLPKYPLDLIFLCFKINNDLIDSLQVLIPIKISWHLCELSLHVLQSLLLVLKFLNSLFDLLLEALYLLRLELILDPLLIDLLLLLEYLLIYGLLVLFPLVSQVLQLLLNLRDLILKDS